MSTKMTVAYDKNFHLYKEAGDQEHIYLELESNHFEAGYGRVMLPIPVHIWEVIREFHGVRFHLADLSDTDLRQKVESEVDQRIQKWKEDRKQKKGSIWLWAGGLAFGAADEPWAKQISAGLRYYRRERKWQREVRSAVEKLRSANSPEGRRKRQEEHNRKALKAQAARKLAAARKNP